MSDHIGISSGASVDTSTEAAGSHCQLSGMTRNEIVAGVCECVGLVVDIDPGSISEGQRIIEDLGADSLDLLDLIFQLEQRFSIRIKTGDIDRRAKVALGDTPMEVNGVYTSEALEQLRKAMPEVPAEEFAEGFRTADLPKCFRVTTFVNLARRLMEEQHG